MPEVPFLQSAPQSFIRIGPAEERDFTGLTNIWERAVRATHTFLTEDAITEIRHDVYDIYLRTLDTYVAWNSQNTPAGFISLQGNHIGMLFVDPPYHRKGIGKALVQYALALGAVSVDVNEQNPAAHEFYKALGFVVRKRSAHDAQGNPFPILHLHLLSKQRGPMRIRDNCIYAFDKTNEPIVRVQAPCHLVFDTSDAFGGQVQSEQDILEELDFSHVNPATGPVYFENAHAGDTLAVHIQSIKTADKGSLVTAPNLGVIAEGIRSHTVICPIKDDHFTLFGVEMPTKPMIGVIGVAPAGEGVATGTPGAHGGNMDTADICAGSTLYLPVFVDGALLAMGDLHAAMGDGEVGGTGVEVSGEVAVAVNVLNGLSIPCPLLKTATEMAFLASADSTDQAIKDSISHMHAFLVANTQLNAEQAMMLMSVCGHARISQLVDPLLTARFCMPRCQLKKFGVSLAF